MTIFPLLYASSSGKACNRPVDCTLNRKTSTNDEDEANNADQSDYVEKFFEFLALLGKTDLIFIVIEEDYVSFEGWLSEDCPVVEGLL